MLVKTLLVLTLASCGVAAAPEAGAPSACRVDGPATGELARGAICEALAPALAAAPAGATLVITMPSDRRATARIVGADGGVLVEVGASSSDRPMHASAWRSLADTLAQQLERAR